jgi:hypothetical protein
MSEKQILGHPPVKEFSFLLSALTWIKPKIPLQIFFQLYAFVPGQLDSEKSTQVSSARSENRNGKK